jgi:hypothetical protein
MCAVWQSAHRQGLHQAKVGADLSPFLDDTAATTNNAENQLAVRFMIVSRTSPICWRRV